MSKLLLSSLDKLSLIDIVSVFYNRPDKSFYEIAIKDDPQELPYYRQLLLQDEKLKKVQACVSLEETALKDFKEKKIKTYVFEELITYQFFRVEDTIYSLEEFIPSYSRFFEDLEYLPKLSVTFFDDVPESYQFTTDFIIFQPQKDKIDILKFQKIFQQFTTSEV